MTTSELISLIASLASLILAIIAIWLSIVFYRMSTAVSDDIKDAAKGISANVERLEKLFDRLYSDTFSMVKDTVTDMRKHIWPEDVPSGVAITEEIEKRADASIDRLRHEMSAELVKIIDRQAGTDQKLSSLSNEVGQVLDRAISKTREVELEAREETLREAILSVVDSDKTQDGIDALTVVEKLAESDFAFSQVLQELNKMRTDHLLEISERLIGPGTKIKRASPAGT